MDAHFARHEVVEKGFKQSKKSQFLLRFGFGLAVESG